MKCFCFALLLISAVGSLAAQTYQPTRESVDQRPTGIAVELPELPENLRTQPAWVLKIGQ